MFRTVKKFLTSPNGKRFVAWALPIVIGWVLNRLSQNDKKSSKSSRGKRR